MGWYDRVCFVQWLLIEFLVAEKESVMSIHRWLNSVSCLSADDKSTVSCWASQISGFEKDQAELRDICHWRANKHSHLDVASACW